MKWIKAGSEPVPGFDYVVEIRRVGSLASTMAVDINVWCQETFGPGITNFANVIDVPSPGVRWCARVWFGYFEYSFRSESDATLFRLKWC